jgi:hypothetical protein
MPACRYVAIFAASMETLRFAAPHFPQPLRGYSGFDGVGICLAMPPDRIAVLRTRA